MKEFFLILLFGKAVLLTPDLINIQGRLELVPDKPVSAITSGASIRIDISSMISKADRDSILLLDEKLSAMFLGVSIRAMLIGEEKTKVALEYNGAYLVGKDTIELTLDADGGVPTGIDFRKVIIESNIELPSVRIHWINYKH